MEVGHVGVPRCVKCIEIIWRNTQFLLYKLYFLEMSTDSGAEKSGEDSEGLADRIPVLSDYVKGLEVHVKRRYLEKIAIIGLDPAAVPSEQFKPECLPPVEATDLLSYLVLDTSYYIKQQFKAYKSLEAFN